jgi:hypothetical protein
MLALGQSMPDPAVGQALSIGYLAPTFGVGSRLSQFVEVPTCLQHERRARTL